MKKPVALLLSLVLLLSFLPLFSFAAEQTTPVIHIFGFMSCPIYDDPADESSARLFPPEKNAILDMVKRLLPAVSSFTVTKNWARFGDRLIPALNDLLLPVGNDEKGDPKGSTGARFVRPEKAQIAETGRADFAYDWRDDPFVSARELAAFVDYVADDCGFGKVALECHSYGGIVTLTYLALFGTEKVKSCCFNATAVYGAAFAGELMRGRVRLSADALAAFLEGLFDHTEYEGILRAVVSLFDDMGGLAFLCNFINEMFEHLSSRIWKESIVPVFGNWLSVWSMVPDEAMEDAYAFVFSGIRSPDTDDGKVFLGRVKHFNSEIRTRREARLRAVDDACGLYVVARYGYAGVPLGDIWQANSDGVLNTESESFGATCRTFSFSEPPETPLQLIAPNGAIDASTCLFPRQTWFVRNYKHTQKDPAMDAFTATLLRADGQQTVDSLEEYPQFLFFDKTLRALRPDVNQIAAAASWQQDVKKLLRSLWERFLNLFRFSKRQAA